jgi:hypothetical protein
MDENGTLSKYGKLSKGYNIMIPQKKPTRKAATFLKIAHKIYALFITTHARNCNTHAHEKRARARFVLRTRETGRRICA